MAEKGDAAPRKFGTFDGVFTPCTLTILGVIMFLRVGHVVGQAGVISALLIVLCSKVITALTSLSLSAIATNTRVKGGGAYYLISRSLGVEFGGAIGVVFFLALAISVSLYVVGFTEAFVGAFPGFRENFTVIASFINIATFICVYIGAGWTLRLQTWILGVLAAAIVSFAVGAFIDFDTELLRANLSPGYIGDENFFRMFALFFPAVTGIMAGANMSGDLEKPALSIPKGTLYSVLITAAIYMLQVVLLGGSRSREALLGNNLIMEEVSVLPVLIVIGVFAATLSSALGSMMGAPRILQALCRDNVFSGLSFFGAGSGPQAEPRRAVVLTFVLAQACVMLGDLDVIAPIITMFFMITYGLLNAATFYEGVTRNPSYRPTFRYSHWSLSLLGAIGCFAVMLLINWLWATVAVLIIFLIHRYISHHEIEARWGSLQSGYAFERVRKSLLRLQDEAYHPKNWRPNLLALSGSAWTRPHLSVWGHWLTSGHGILTIAQVVQGDLDEHAERRSSYERTLRKFIRKQGLQAFPAIVIANSLSSGIESLVQCHGIGGLRPNTTLLGWPNSEETLSPFGSSIRLISRMQRSIICGRFLHYRKSSPGDESTTEMRELVWRVPQGSIDVWWRGMDNGALMMILAHLLHTCPGWRQAPIRVLRIVSSEEGREEVRKHILELAVSARIKVEPVVLISDNVSEAIQTASASAGVVMLRFEPPEEGKEGEFFRTMEEFVGELPRVLFINSAGGVELDT